jgi:hypothetical protein
MAIRPRPQGQRQAPAGVLLIDGEPQKNTTGKFYVERREDGKRVKKPRGTSPREALDVWRERVAILEGTLPELEVEAETVGVEGISIDAAED